MFLYFTKSSCYTRIIHRTAANNALKSVQQRSFNISCQVEPLTSRGLIRVYGNDAMTFLQGIVTNDMRHFQENCKSLFTMFLNTKGRVLYDTLIYKINAENTFYIECDRDGLQELVKHLKLYRVRRKIDIDSIDDELKLWVLFNPKEVEISNSDAINTKQEQVVPCTFPDFEDGKSNTYFKDIILSDSINVYPDPRLSSLGCRVIAPTKENVVDSVQKAGIQVESSLSLTYRMFRYRLGVGEGTKELPIGNCFPLEANCDYLHGVSFHKGCYIGQELTARTHHTGVVRKRLMPLILQSEVLSSDFPLDSPIETVTGQKKIGKLRGLEQNCALGLMKITEALEGNKIKIANTQGETVRPFWWPQELPKERMDSGSSKGN